MREFTWFLSQLVAMRFYCVLLLLVWCYTTMAAICPTDWQRYGESCYLLITESMSWADAKTSCLKSNAALAVPNSNTEQTFIWSAFLKIFNGEPTDNLWIGCYFNSVAGGWQHCPLRDVPDTFEHWRQEKPDSIGNRVCVTMDKRDNGRWNNEKCSYIHFAICELQVDITPHSFCLQTGPDGRIKSQCLVGHVMKELRADGVVSCGKACRSEPRCRSFNLLMKQGPGKMVCQLNNATRHEETDLDIMEKGNCYYFDP